MSKIIIGIHGLGNKPTKEILEKWWLKAICEGLIKVDRFQFEPEFELVYWADVLNDKPLNNLITDPENPYFLDEPYIESTGIVIPKLISNRKKFLGFLEVQMDKIFLNEDLSPNFEFVSDVIFKKYFKELEIYYSKQPEVNDPTFKTVQDIIRNRLADVLRKHKGKEILLLAHSMGSIIAYDVCSFVLPDIKINTLVTIGAPLGMPIIISKIAEEVKIHQPNIVKLETPRNISKNWFNYSDIEDSVALNYNLADDYEANENGVKVEDKNIINDYIAEDIPNPHKSYGYLRANDFSNMIADFITEDESKASLWWLKYNFKKKKLFKRIKDKFFKSTYGDINE